jgi:hypothetical protein
VYSVLQAKNFQIKKKNTERGENVPLWRRGWEYTTVQEGMGIYHCAGGDGNIPLCGGDGNIPLCRRGWEYTTVQEGRGIYHLQGKYRCAEDGGR